MAPTLTVSIGSLLWPAAAAIAGSALLSSKIWWSNWCGSCACFGVLLGQPKMLLYLDIFSGEIVIWWRTTVLSYIIVLPLRRFLNLDRLVMIWFKSVLQKSIPISGRFGCQRQNCQQEEVVFAAEACLPTCLVGLLGIGNDRMARICQCRPDRRFSSFSAPLLQ